MAKKIYLSGKISGDPDFKEKFASKEKELTEQGHLVFNPALHPDMFTWEQFMELDLKALGNCDAIYLLEDWKDSRGAKIEYDEAVKLGKEIIFENKLEQNKTKSVIKETLTDITPESLAEKYATEKADKGNIDIEQLSALKKAFVEGFNTAKKVLMQQEKERAEDYTIAQKNNNELDDSKKEIWNDYVSSVRSFLPEEELNDRNKVLKASKMALASLTDEKDAIRIINSEFIKRGVKSKFTLIEAIKEAAYPELTQEKEKAKKIEYGREK